MVGIQPTIHRVRHLAQSPFQAVNFLVQVTRRHTVATRRAATGTMQYIIDSHAIVLPL